MGETSRDEDKPGSPPACDRGEQVAGHAAPSRSESSQAVPSGREARNGRPTVLVSACLLGVTCRHDGTSRERPELLARLNGSRLVPVCPEQLGGLPTPRIPCRIEGGTGTDVLAGRARVVDEKGLDRTENFLRGAEESVKLARKFGATKALLKSRSPSCDAQGGVAAAALRTQGLDVEGVD